MATNDVHYINKEDAKPGNLICIQTGKTIGSDRMFETDAFYLKSPDEMWDILRIPQALENTLRIADRCNVEITFESCIFKL